MNKNAQQNRFEIPWSLILLVGGVLLVLASFASLASVHHPVEILEGEGVGIESVELYEAGSFAGGLSVQVGVTDDVQAVNLISDKGSLADRQEVYAGVDSVVLGSSGMDIGERWLVVAVGSDGEVIGTVAFEHNLEFWWDRPPIGSN